MSRIIAEIFPPLLVPQRARTDFTISVFAIAADGSRSPADLTDCTLVFQAKSSEGEAVIQKVSSDEDQIELGGTPSEGTATLKFVGVDTQDLNVLAPYWFDLWLLKAGGATIVPVVERQPFRLGPIVFNPDTSDPLPVADLPSVPLIQDKRFRRFVHTWSATGDSDTVTVPGTGMLADVYAVIPVFEDIPEGGAAAVIVVPSATRTTSQFVAQASGEVTEGTTIMFTLMDASG